MRCIDAAYPPTQPPPDSGCASNLSEEKNAGVIHLESDKVDVICSSNHRNPKKYDYTNLF